MNAVSVGVPELIVMGIALITWILPIAAVIWALVMLNQIRAEQALLRNKLETIERSLVRRE